jgi:hypothetical protein
MPKQLPADLLARVQTELASCPDGRAIEDLSARLAKLVSRRSLQRKLAHWVADGHIRAAGSKKGRRYFLPVSPAERTIIASAATPHESNSSFVAQTSADDYPPISTAGREVLALVRRPIFDRSSVGYHRAFLDSYVPNETAYLPESAIRHLHELGSPRQEGRPAGTFARDILDRLLIDLSWASSRLEGNTYSLLDTERLINAGQEAAGKNAKETRSPAGCGPLANYCSGCCWDNVCSHGDSAIDRGNVRAADREGRRNYRSL